MRGTLYQKTHCKGKIMEKLTGIKSHVLEMPRDTYDCSEAKANCDSWLFRRQYR